jgi:hypothetical protein
MTEISPGRAAYEAQRREVLDRNEVAEADRKPSRWEGMGPIERDSWEAAAKAAIATGPGTPSGDDPSWRERAGIVHGADELIDLLSLVGVTVTPADVDRWTADQREAARDWAAREHLHASDNPVERVPRPQFLAEQETKP